MHPQKEEHDVSRTRVEGAHRRRHGVCEFVDGCITTSAPGGKHNQRGERPYKFTRDPTLAVKQKYIRRGKCSRSESVAHFSSEKVRCVTVLLNATSHGRSPTHTHGQRPNTNFPSHEIICRFGSFLCTNILYMYYHNSHQVRSFHRATVAGWHEMSNRSNAQ